MEKIDENSGNQENEPTLKDSLKMPIFWHYTIYYNFMNIRAKSFMGWIYPWMDWTFAGIVEFYF